MANELLPLDSVEIRIPIQMITPELRELSSIIVSTKETATVATIELVESRVKEITNDYF